MAVTFTWSVPMTERNLADGGIAVIHWRCDGVDGDYSASSYGTTSHTPDACLLYTSPSPRDRTRSRMPSSA